MKEKIQQLAQNLSEDEAALLFQLLLKSFETANYQKVEYQNKDLIGEQSLMVNVELDLKNQGPKIIKKGVDLTLVATGYSTHLALEAAKILTNQGIDAEVIDIRVLSPLSPELILKSVTKTGRLVVVDGGWSPTGFAGEIIATVTESIDPKLIKSSPKRVTLPFAPAPSAANLEKLYYPTALDVVRVSIESLNR